MYNFYFFFKNNYLYYRFSLPLKILVKKRIFEKGRLVLQLFATRGTKMLILNF